MNSGFEETAHHESPFVRIPDAIPVAEPETERVGPRKSFVTSEQILVFETIERDTATNAREGVPREVEIAGAPSIIN
jgi:hypothetical protein